MDSPVIARILSLVAAIVAATLGSAYRPVEAENKHDRAPQIVVISLDGARPDIVESFLRSGVLDKKVGLGRLDTHGVVASQNITLTPSLTAVSHIGIATGSSSARNDIPSNFFHPVATNILTGSISGFAAPIGGYTIDPLGEATPPTAEPLWVRLRQAGKKVVTATWPGSDGADIRIAGMIVQHAMPTRVVDYTVPFGAFGGLSARGFTLDAASFGAAPAVRVAQLAAAGHSSFSPVKVTPTVETIFCSSTTGTCGNTSAAGGLRYDVGVAALDSTDDGLVNYDTLVVFDANVAIGAEPFVLPSTGPAYLRRGGSSGRFFFEGSGNKIGTAYFVSHLEPDLSTVRFARYAANFIPRNAPVLGAVDDINTHVGFWAPQADFRIPERLPPNGVTFAGFPDEELEAMYTDQVATFVKYQTDVALRAIAQNPDADLVMIYIEQPDGSGHQFTLTDRRQPTNPLDNKSVGVLGDPVGAIGQDPAKIARYARYLAFAYQQANAAVDAIINATGSAPSGQPLRDVLVVSDHGMAAFHTAVSLRNLLIAGGFDVSQLGLRTSGPAANIYVNLQGRESGGSVTPEAFPTLVAQVAQYLRAVSDPNGFYNPEGTQLFPTVFSRPNCGGGQPGLCTDEHIGQDTGDVLALMAEGYNFDGIQSPVVLRLGDPVPVPVSDAIYSVPNFYGAHGHDSTLPSMSAILYAAGPHVKNGHKVDVIQNIDIAPTVMEILGVAPAATMEGTVLEKMLKK